MEVNTAVSCYFALVVGQSETVEKGQVSSGILENHQAEFSEDIASLWKRPHSCW
jgi:hypothetical protein